uniref:Uncharacterized protein n=1 Tax=Acidobacterium capsulatum TaxID=33075 RepID=A0A7V5CTJ5_9BACT
MGDALKALEEQYFLINDNYGSLFGQCATDDQKAQLQKLLTTARTNYWSAINKVLHDDDPEVQSLTSQLNTLKLTLQATIDSGQNIAAVLGAIAQAVGVGTQLAGLAISL